MQIKTTAIYLNRSKPQSSAACTALQEQLTAAGVNNYVLEYQSVSADIKDGTDLIICIGGDGTLLRAARAAAGRDIKLLGINSGSLGFLASAEANGNFKELAQDIACGNFTVHDRILLDLSIMRDGQQVFHDIALNECVIKTCQARATSLSANYAGQEIKEFFGDGLIIATPTGSTAYNMAAGGPIAFPSLDAFILTPVCPHTLAQRPLVLPAQNPLTITITPKKQTVSLIVSLDGQINFVPQYGDILTITKSPKGITIIYPKDYEFFNTLTSKLKWGSR